MAIKSLEELKKLRASMQKSIDLRKKGESDDNAVEVLVGMGTCGIAAGARETFNEILTIVEDKNLDNVKVISVGCIGHCSMEPVVQINMPNRESLIYGKITKENAENLIQTVIVEEGYIEENLLIESFVKAAL